MWVGDRIDDVSLFGMGVPLYWYDLCPYTTQRSQELDLESH